MKALIDALPEFQARGVNLVAMAPEVPDRSLAFAESHHLPIDILSDTGNRVSEQLGLVFELPQALRPIYEKSGTDLPTINGDGTFKLPVPATYIIDREARIVFDFVNADYRLRFEPMELVAKLDQLELS
jgi:peroxiredoxin